MFIHSQERSERQEALKWNPETGYALSNSELSHALCIDDILAFYRSDKCEEVNSPRESFNWDLRVRKLRDIVSKHMKTAPSYLANGDMDTATRTARGVAIYCLTAIDGMSTRQISVFAEDCFGNVSASFVCTENRRTANLIKPKSGRVLANEARAAIREYSLRMPLISRVFEQRKERELEIAQNERDNIYEKPRIFPIFNE